MTCNGNRINLPKSVTIKFKDKFKIRHMMKREPLLLHIMLKWGINWFTLPSNNPPINCISQYRYSCRQWLVISNQSVTFSLATSVVHSQRTPLILKSLSGP